MNVYEILKKRGFTYEGQTGGNCSAFVKTLGRYSIWITDTGGCDAPRRIDEPIIIGLFLDEEAQIDHAVIASGLRSAVDYGGRFDDVENEFIGLMELGATTNG